MILWELESLYRGQDTQNTRLTMTESDSGRNDAEMFMKVFKDTSDSIYMISLMNDIYLTSHNRCCTTNRTQRCRRRDWDSQWTHSIVPANPASTHLTRPGELYNCKETVAVLAKVLIWGLETADTAEPSQHGFATGSIQTVCIQI